LEYRSTSTVLHQHTTHSLYSLGIDDALDCFMAAFTAMVLFVLIIIIIVVVVIVIVVITIMVPEKDKVQGLGNMSQRARLRQHHGPQGLVSIQLTQHPVARRNASRRSSILLLLLLLIVVLFDSFTRYRL
jgi:hypothetical protein